MRPLTASCSRRSSDSARANRSSVILVVVLVDRDLDGAVARPVLRVDGAVGDGGVESQPVALLAVVERALEDRRRRLPARAAAAAAAAAAATPRRLVVVVIVLVLVVLLGG